MTVRRSVRWITQLAGCCLNDDWYSAKILERVGFLTARDPHQWKRILYDVAAREAQSAFGPWVLADIAS